MRLTNRLHLAQQPDEKVLSGLARLIALDRQNKARFLIYLAEAIKRKLYAQEGYGSVFRFLTEKHELSENSALKRLQVTKLAMKFPFLFDQIAQGVFSLSALSRLAPFVNGANASILFNGCRGKSVRETEALLLQYFPKEEVEDKLRKKVTALGVDRFQIQFTADKAFTEDLEKATALLSHRFPQGRMKDVLGLALKTLLCELGKEPATQSKPVENVVRIPRGIQREVWKRDEARCQQRRPDGSVCGETWFLEIDHIQPFALGGRHRKENLRLLCWAHNQIRAQTTFGKKWSPRK